MNFGSAGSNKPKAWKDIWGAGQGIGAIEKRMSTAEYVDRLENEYLEACEKLAGNIR